MTLANFLEQATKAAQVIAVMGGAIWGLYLYRRNRTHKHRLRLRVTAERIDRGGTEYLAVKAELENVGLERVAINHEACDVTIFADLIPPGVDFPWGSTLTMEPWEEVGIFPMLKGTQYLEPNSLVNDQVLMAVPGFRDRFLKVLAHAQSKTVGWNAVFLSPPTSPSDGQTGVRKRG